MLGTDDAAGDADIDLDRFGDGFALERGLGDEQVDPPYQRGGPL
ncbi:MAG: hypothetical protein ABI629_16490 [bacterium]